MSQYLYSVKVAITKTCYNKYLLDTYTIRLPFLSAFGKWKKIKESFFKKINSFKKYCHA